jgi:chemotaxis protein methyltransferase CheR
MITGAAPTSGLGATSVLERVRGLTGLDFPEGRRDTLWAGLAQGMKRAGTSHLEVYLSRLETESALLDDLVAEITVGETYFFRDPEQFRVIRERILPDLIHRRHGAPLRVWSAGCATGEEAYTLAILHEEACGPAPARILGTDLSRSALARARRGRYGRWALRGLSPDEVARYFHRSGTDFVVAPEFTRVVEFRYLNLAADRYPSMAAGTAAMDLILCRNVLIYFDTETAARVARRLMESLAPGGWLLLGASDPHPVDPVPCEVVITGAGLAYRRIVTPSRATPAQVLTPSAPFEALPPLPARAPVDPPFEGPSPERSASPARSLSPDGDLPALVARVRSLANAGDLSEAEAACASALDRHHTSAELTYLHGVLMAEAGHPAAASAALRASLYLDRTLIVAHVALGGVLARIGDDAGACRALRNAERLLATEAWDAEVPGSDGERAGRMAAAARVHIALLAGEDAP